MIWEKILGRSVTLSSVFLYVIITERRLCEGREFKPTSARAFCGADFIRVWRMLCLRQKHHIKRRSIDISYLQRKLNVLTNSLIEKKSAREFLKPRVRIRRHVVVASDTDNGDEECCKETCTTSEIQGYPC